MWCTESVGGIFPGERGFAKCRIRCLVPKLFFQCLDQSFGRLVSEPVIKMFTTILAELAGVDVAAVFYHNDSEIAILPKPKIILDLFKTNSREHFQRMFSA